VDLSAHRTVLALARDPSGVTRLVTTNFDLLFASRAKPRSCFYFAPLKRGAQA
jgi:hypothetical protein